MIPSQIAEVASQALGALALKSPPKSVADAALRVQRVFKTYAGDDDAFNPVDFTESDLSEATKVFEAAARKDIVGFETAAKSAHSAFRAAMNEAHGTKDRTKCRATLVIELVVAATKKL